MASANGLAGNGAAAAGLANGGGNNGAPPGVPGLRQISKGPAVIKEMGAEHLTDAKFRVCFNAMRMAEEMCDVIIVVEGREIKAHKLILSGCSPYFRGMFRWVLDLACVDTRLAISCVSLMVQCWQGGEL